MFLIHSCITKTHLFKYILKILPPKHEHFLIKISDIFHIPAQNIDCGYSLEPPQRGGSNEYPQSMVWAKIRKNNVYPCKPQFYYIKVGFKGVKLNRRVFVMPGVTGKGTLINNVGLRRHRMRHLIRVCTVSG